MAKLNVTQNFAGFLRGTYRTNIEADSYCDEPKAWEVLKEVRRNMPVPKPIPGGIMKIRGLIGSK